MCTPSLRSCLAAGLICAAGWLPVRAQQAAIEVPFVGLNHGFFERVGLAWGLSGPGFAAQFNNGFAAALPQFGGFQPAAGAVGGVAWGGGGLQGGLFFEAAQGVRASNVSQVPLVVLPNGQVGFVGDVALQPFVVGVVPIVNDFVFFPTFVAAPTPAARALTARRAAHAAGEEEFVECAAPQVAEQQAAPAERPAAGASPSTARRPVVSLAELRRRKARMHTDLARKAAVQQPLLLAPQVEKEQGAAAVGSETRSPSQSAAQRQAEEYLALGLDAERKGQFVEARVAYRLAARRATGVLREIIQHKLAALPQAP